MFLRSRKLNVMVATIAVLSLSVQIASVAAAHSSHPSPADHLKRTATTIDRSPSSIAATFETMLKKANQIPQAITYFKANLNKLSKDQATAMVLKLENAILVQEELIEKRLGNHKVQTALGKVHRDGQRIEQTIALTKDASLKKLLKEVYASGYQLVMSDAYIVPFMDYAVLIPFSSSVSPDIKEYIEIMAAETDRMMIPDEGNARLHEGLVTRALAMENFTKDYPKSQRTSTIKQKFDGYEFTIYYGMNHTPLFDYNTKIMQPEAVKAYHEILANKEAVHSPFLTQLQKFMNLVKKNKYKRTSEVDKFIQAKFG
ncbi:hypothetical protein [Paenibacillus sp. 481]|uniref:hypothetical protein n=1 Tax=Paenibacillus sp. 481 TaxID=2835869 RepID=UPI001E5C91D7|nr:hypothetical protein [Paenibacillus sp. 481]UHA73235.1 hypothetical protein KIK04_22065 [Paenibacillus sp. 481]